MKTQTIFTFSHAPEIYADLSGQFFRMADDKPIKTTYHAGRIAVRDKAKIYGIKRLRSNAIKTTKKIDVCPF